MPFHRLPTSQTKPAIRPPQPLSSGSAGQTRQPDSQNRASSGLKIWDSPLGNGSMIRVGRRRKQFQMKRLDGWRSRETSQTGARRIFLPSAAAEICHGRRGHVVMSRRARASIKAVSKESFTHSRVGTAL
jgi:hypothetical protein